MKKIFLLMCLWAFQLNANAQNITISEVNYKSYVPGLDCGDWLELHNFGSTAIDVSNWKVTDSLNNSPYIFTAGTSIAAGGYLVLFRDLGKFNTVYGTSTILNITGPFGFKINSFDTLKVFDANDNLVVKSIVNGDYPWPDGADGEGRTLELINQNSNIGLMLPQSWRDGCMLGSPGKAPQANCNDAIIISEVNYNSDSLKSIGEFIEFYNNTTNAINLAGWSVKDGVDSVQNTFTFPAGTSIAANGYLVISNDTAALNKYKRVVPNLVKDTFGFNLSNGGEVIRLFNQNNVLQFSFHYRDSLPWTDSADGKGYTLQIKDRFGRTNDGKNYFAGCLGGSPGGPYEPICKPFFPVRINDVLFDDKNIYPTICSQQVTVQNAKQYFETIQLVNTIGSVVLNKKINSNLEIINMQELPNGIYILQLLQQSGQSYNAKLIKQ
jgi:Lamin Tail Domain/Secretion system C-terminal sorting domain